MQVEVRQIEPSEAEADLVVIGLCEGEDLPAEIATAPGAADAKGAFKKLLLLHPQRPARLLVVGLGKRDQIDVERARIAAALAAREAAQLQARSLAWALPEPTPRPRPPRASPRA